MKRWPILTLAGAILVAGSIHVSAQRFPVAPISASQIGGVTVSATAPTSGQFLRYDGASWAPYTSAAAGASLPLSIANGGTGSATQPFVDLTTSQSIAGTKTFATSPIAPGLNGSGTIAVAASGTVNFIADALFNTGETWTVSDGTRSVIFTVAAGGGQFGVAGANCSAWPCTYAIPFHGGGGTAAQIGTCFGAGIINQDGASCSGAVPTTGLAITSSGSSSVTLTNTSTGTTGNITITETVSNAGFTVSGMSGGVTGVTSAMAIGTSSTAGSATTSITLGHGAIPITLTGSSTLDGDVTITGTPTFSTAIPIASGGTAATTASGARTALGLAIGTNVEAWDADLDALAALSSTAGVLSRTGAGAFAVRTLTQGGGVTISNADGSGGNPTFSLANVPNSALLNSSVTVSPGTGMSGGGTVALGGTITLTAAPASNSIGATQLATTAQRYLAGLALASAGAVTLTGAKVGDTVTGVVDITSATSVKVDFESTITVNDQIQQTAGVLTAHVITVLLVAKGG